MTRYLLFSSPQIPNKIDIQCPTCRFPAQVESDEPVGQCNCGEVMDVVAPLIQSGLYCWVQAFRECGGVGEMFATMDKDYLEKFDIVHVNYTPGHPSYIESLRKVLGKSSTKLVANVDYAMSLWETINPLNLKHQLDMADMVFHVESTGARMLSHYLDRKVWTIPHPVDVRHIKQNIKTCPDERTIVTCQWHRYNATWSAYYYGLYKAPVRRWLVAFSGQHPGKLVDLECMFERVVPAVTYPQYLSSILGKAQINCDLAPDTTYGRGVVDAAALGIPTIGSSTIEAARIIWPELTVKPYDHIETHKAVSRLLNDVEFFQDMIDRGEEMCNLWDCSHAHAKMMEALDG